VIDGGTEFGVSVQPDGDLEVHVFEGAVDLATTTKVALPQRLNRLRAGQAKRLDAGAITTWQEVAMDLHRFVRKPPSQRLFNT